MFSEVVDQGWKKDVEAKSLETVDLSGLVLREGILPQWRRGEGVGGGGGVGGFDLVLH